uniref:50S ribosomal protein L35 n=1 Tax=Vischeria sp. ACOI 3415 TaxID=2506143 RepID=A0A410D3C6_9STRA|nr:ribosomal protein L35 [Vischeria sp. ACOI 3415]QAA12182.1 ribosomal protein L35 [Vischeria sp. ACOI 3415]
MYKIKTRRSAIKRYKKTVNNNFLRKRAYKSHLLEKKSSSRKRRLSGKKSVSNTEKSIVKKFFNN